MRTRYSQSNQLDLKAAKILIIDDEPANVQLLEQVLAQGGYVNYRSTTDSRHALPVFQEFGPDLVLLDLLMPHFDGYAVMKQLSARVEVEGYLPILVLTADITRRAREKALSLGARDFLTKPIDVTEVLLRIRNLLETRLIYQQLRRQNRTLEERVEERTRELEEVQYEILERLAVASEYRDDQTGEHTRRVGKMSEKIALAMGLPPEHAWIIGFAAVLHDIGKIGIPDMLLLKHSGLTPAEFEVMKTHTTIGARILAASRFPVLQVAESIALTHHERWDGTGYAKLAGESIPVEGRIVAVADAFDAMVNDRPYRKALSLEEALAELARSSGTQFDPQIVAALLNLESNDLLQLDAAIRTPCEDGAGTIPTVHLTDMTPTATTASPRATPRKTIPTARE